MGDLRTALRAVAHPGSVLALVVLVLNDHVLKQAWPGWVTGKLSDVAGLVVAPLLLSVVLTLLRVPRPAQVAFVATGAGFVFCKTTDFGAGVTSAVWSLFGTPTMIRADVTDLLALPALYASWRVHRTAVGQEPAGWRRTAAASVGMVVLPIGVLATSATSCVTDEGVWGVDAVTGRFTGTDQRHFFVVTDDRHGVVRIDPKSGEVSDLAGPDLQRMVEPALGGSVSCDARGMTCWRVEDQVVEISRDGGVTWTADLSVSEDEQATSVEGVDPGCGDDASAWMVRIAVMDVDGEVTVAVSAKHAGVWLRGVDGSWRLVPRQAFEVDPVRVPSGPVRGRLQVVYVPPARSQDGWVELSPTPSSSPSPACATPSMRTVTPNPSNGPPTTYEVCPQRPPGR